MLWKRHQPQPQDISFPGNSSLELFFRQAQRVLNLDFCPLRAYFSNGTTLDSVEEILEHDLLHMCLTVDEPFRSSQVEAAGAGKDGIDAVVGRCWLIGDELGRVGRFFWILVLGQMLNQDDSGPTLSEYVGGLFEGGIGDTNVHCSEPCVCGVCCVKANR